MNPITDDLPDEAKAELAAEFRDLALRYPPRRRTARVTAVTRMSRTRW